jgi:hypothetical protein
MTTRIGLTRVTGGRYAPRTVVSPEFGRFGLKIVPNPVR